MKGKVKMFNNEKGFGFISQDNGKDVFFHYSSLICDGFKTAKEGDPVEFDVEETDRGLRATNVRKISE